MEDPIGGIARIVASDREGNNTPADRNQILPEMNLLGSNWYGLTLEVRLPDRETYEVTGRFKVPVRAENVSLFDIADKIQPGVELPVRVDRGDPKKLEIVWDTFLKDPSRKHALREAKQAASNRQMAEKLDKDTKLRDKLRADNRMAAEAWAMAVRAGNISREEFEQTVQLEVDAGRMDPADAEAARATLD